MSAPPYTEAREMELFDLLIRLGVATAEDSPEALNLTLYHQALLHSSYAYEQKKNDSKKTSQPRSALTENYERLEFLGDAVLKLIVSEYLYERFPDYREGDLTKIRAVIVSDSKLADIARELDLGSHLIFGPSELRNGGAKKTSNLACAFEALLGAMFLSGKMLEARNLLTELLEDQITEVDSSKTKDNYKAVLQEMTQAEDGGLPYYKTVKESGPSHNRTFTVEVSIRGEVIGVGNGKTKKEAQQNAAKMALTAMNASTD